MSTIIWIDPGTTTTWFAILCKQKGKKLEIIDYWVIYSEPKIDISLKLLEIWNDINSLIKQYKPVKVAVEKLFFTNNIKTWIDVAHARWVILYEIIKAWIEVEEYTPLEVKQAVTGYGKADKKQLQRAIQMLLKLDSIPKPDDAADALALAYIWSLSVR